MHSRRTRLSLAALAGVVLLLNGAGVAAQEIFESAGERALGMGGAFVAVADDATAVHWNPAGLPKGGPAGMTIGWYRFQSGNRDEAPRAGPVRRDAKFTSLGTLPLGLSYGHFDSARLVAPVDGSGLIAENFRSSQVAVSLLQSLTEGLVIGTTVKYIRGGLASVAVDRDSIDSALAQAAELKTERSGALDLDIGIMADMKKVRIGLTVKNLRSPTFGGIADNAMTLRRQSRLGVALLPTSGLTLAIDVDLDTVDLRGGLRRMFAIGGEERVGKRFAVRSGVHWNREGSRRPVAAVGMSVSVRRGLWLDGHYSHGQDDEAREFGAGLRAGF